MKIIITNSFKKTVKKLISAQISQIEDVIEEIAHNPTIGEQKKGDLAGVWVYKFRLQKQLMLMAYQFSKKELVLLSLNTHENF